MREWESRLIRLDDGERQWVASNERPYLPRLVLHREDGPAIEATDGGKEWWVGGRFQYSDYPPSSRSGRRGFGRKNAWPTAPTTWNF